MDRMTTKSENGTYYIADVSLVNHDENGFFGDAVSKLAKFENVCDDLLAQQQKISDELDRLRMEDKTRTTKFKQLLANKMMNNNILIMFRSYGI